MPLGLCLKFQVVWPLGSAFSMLCFNKYVSIKKTFDVAF